jgi:hypothetical protein
VIKARGINSDITARPKTARGDGGRAARAWRDPPRSGRRRYRYCPRHLFAPASRSSRRTRHAYRRRCRASSSPPPGRSRPRAVELAAQAVRLGRSLIAVTPTTTPNSFNTPTPCYRYTATPREEFHDCSTTSSPAVWPTPLGRQPYPNPPAPCSEPSPRQATRTCETSELSPISTAG